MRKADEQTAQPAAQVPASLPSLDEKKEEASKLEIRLEDMTVTELKALGFDLQAMMAINQQRLNAVINELNKRGI